MQADSMILLKLWPSGKIIKLYLNHSSKNSLLVVYSTLLGFRVSFVAVSTYDKLGK